MFELFGFRDNKNVCQALKPVNTVKVVYHDDGSIMLQKGHLQTKEYCIMVVVN